MIDFDWSYPALLAMGGISLGALMALPLTAPVRSRSPRLRMPALAALLAVVAAGAGLAGNWDRGQRALLQSQGLPGPKAAAVLEQGRALLPDRRIDAQLLEVALAGGFDRGLQLPAPLVRAALRNTADRARVDVNLAVLRDGALYLLGERRQALAASRAKAVTAAAYNVNVVSSYAVLLNAEGRHEEARQMLAREIVQRAGSGYRNATQLLSLLGYLDSLGAASADVACAADALRVGYPSRIDDVNRVTSAAGASASCSELARGPVVA
jgi:hypothetical protein